MHRFALIVIFVVACADDGTHHPGTRPHPQYPALDLDTLPGGGGGALGPYTAPELPSTTRTITISTTGTSAGRDLELECQTDGTAVTVPGTAGDIGVVNLGDVIDCDVTLDPEVVVDSLVIGSLPGPTHAPAHRVRIRGGQIAGLFMPGGSTDIVLDGVAINNGLRPSATRQELPVFFPEGPQLEVVERVVIVNSFIRNVGVAVPGTGDIDGAAYIGTRTRNVMFANNNIVTAGNRSSWGFRLNGGANTLFVDNAVRVSMHKLVRMNTHPVDYVYIKGGVWMREATLTSSGTLINDSFTQLPGSTTDRVYVHDPTVYLLADSLVNFGAVFDAMQVGKLWEARRIQWHALNANVISAAWMQMMQDFCVPGSICDYGAETHTYTYDPALAFPANPWRDLPTFADDNPDHLPTEP